MDKREEYDKFELMGRALAARNHAYAPYSHYAVGAALLTAGGKIYEGCNIENASFGATNCAERTAFFKAVSQDEREFVAIAIAGGPEGEAPADYASPCGICRQVMHEFCREDFRIFLVKNAGEYKEFTLEEILPFAFSL